MNSLIIGTAGHVDHGKTTLIKALTGTDTDRLKEEKERGITIELGFAYLPLPNGEKCGIIDVPGHEKFVRNMLAGAGSVDLALFVVASDEGMMPQSREHLEILSLLGIKRGIIALTKTDAVEKEWLEMVMQDVRSEVKDTFLENAEIVPVSARTGDGIEKLKQRLIEMVTAAGETEDTNMPSRLAIDRVFTIGGFGTVVTGTLIEGGIKVSEELTLYPTMTKVKIRNLQVHSQNVAFAKKGQRVAVNLSNVKTDEIQKGCVLAASGSMQNSDVLDVRLDIVKKTKRKIINSSNLHFFHGTNDVTCRLSLVNAEQLSAGESGYARLHLKTPVSAKAGDRFVVRFYSPMETIGGGVILDPNPQKTEKKIAERFLVKEKGSFKERLACFILDKSKTFPLVKDLKLNPFSNSEHFDAGLKTLVEKGEVFQVRDAVIHKSYLETLSEKCKTILSGFHLNNPLVEGMKKEELCSKLLPKNKQQQANEILSILEEQKQIKILGNLVADSDFKILVTDSQKKLGEEILKIFYDSGFATPSFDETAALFAKIQKTFKQVFDSLAAQGLVIMLTPQIVMHKDFCAKALEIVNVLGKDKEFSLAQFRDEIQSSRKYAVALLEFFDSRGITKKQGDFRVLK